MLAIGLSDLLESGFIVIVIVTILIIIGMLILFTRFLRKIEPGKALIVMGPGTGKEGMKIIFTWGLVIPIIHKTEEMDISTKKMMVERRGKEGLICKDNIRADISVNFYVRVNNTSEDVIQVAQAIGAERASARETLDELFQAKFAEALKTVGKQMDFEDLFQERSRFKEDIIETIGENLNGYSLEDTAIDFLEQTPLESLDPDNIMDAEGIEKISEITLTKKETVEKRKTLARERILVLERQRAEAEAKQQSDIKIVQAREQAEAGKVEEEERLKAESAKKDTNKQLELLERNKIREIGVAEKNTERTLATEAERVIGATELEKIGQQKLIEEQKREISEIIRQRVAVERTVAEEEEQTKDTRSFATADRDKKVTITKAEALAEENFVKDIKAAEAQEKASQFLAQQKEIMAETERKTSEKVSEAKRTMAEGVTAEAAAHGLAEVKVKEAAAEARKKLNLVEAEGIREKGLAEVVVKEAEVEAKKKLNLVEAEGVREKGLAEVKVRESEASAIQKKGEAEATATLKMGEAEATATLKMGEAEARGLEVRLEAEAKGVEQKGLAEAKMVSEKAEAMKLFDQTSRDHEEFRLKLSMDERIALEQIGIQKDIAAAQAEVISAALANAKIDIVGGESEFFDKIVKSISNGKVASAFYNNNQVLTDIKDALTAPGDGNLIHRIRKLLDDIGISSETVKNLSISALLNQIASNSEDKQMISKINELKSLAEKTGVSDLLSGKLLGL